MPATSKPSGSLLERATPAMPTWIRIVWFITRPIWRIGSESFLICSIHCATVTGNTGSNVLSADRTGSISMTMSSPA